MRSKFRFPKLPKINWKLFITIIIIIILVVVAIRLVPKFMSRGDQEVGYQVLEESQVPVKIQEILPRYKMLERALAAKVDEEIYVIVTRGEKLTGGYGVDIEKIQLLKEEEGPKLVIHALFKDPNPDDLVPQVITYPYIVVKTNLTELPQKIDLQVHY
ncbi:protease complex subunit PrcB family protein [Natronincola ferrireducens]|uniref:PrcB C-terminal n=1 Tax=Natronincola ferrireducens TaxID=393762 RepID=A0A1G9G7D6_9FIRM|nr:protease complex subunit PrcB family protein [Natronincola ferrireducens]SDK96455.1 PrcB C-terminal [Natronincola ferrireducens]